MAVLTVFQGDSCQSRVFSPPLLLSHALERSGLALPHPCGGSGTCGKCAVVLQGAVSAPNAAEEAAGTRLSCQAMLLGDAQVTLPGRADTRVAIGGIAAPICLDPMAGRLGAAADIGTTTLAMKLYDMSTGRLLGQIGRENPQTAIAADVMGRISAALRGQGEALCRQVADALCEMLSAVCRQACCPEETVDTLVLTGNTTMLYLLTGRDPEPLSHAPFAADTLFDTQATLLGREAYLPPCIHAFVGADITCAILTSGICLQPETALLCDIGTNGEMALWKDGRLLVTSTAAGPAFEGAGISCGCGSIPGAIDRVWVENGQIRIHTIGDAPAVGICGSGLIDAVAAFLATGQIDETGACDEDFLPLAEGVALLPRDIRAVQLAKAAICAGILTLCQTADIAPEQVQTLYIAGGFGSHLNVAGAAAIGLIPHVLADRVQVIGNAALSGSVQLLLDRSSHSAARTIASQAAHIDLGGNPEFNRQYMEQMLFPESDD